MKYDANTLMAFVGIALVCIMLFGIVTMFVETLHYKDQRISICETDRYNFEVVNKSYFCQDS